MTRRTKTRQVRSGVGDDVAEPYRYRARPPRIPAVVDPAMSRAEMARRFQTVTDLETLRRELRRVEMDLDHREDELTRARDAFHAAERLRDNVRKSVDEVKK